MSEHRTATFSYPPVWRFLYLWLPEMIAVGTCASYVWAIPLFLTSIPFAVLVPASLLISFAELVYLRHGMCRQPIEIRFEDRSVSLVRHEVYRQFSLDDVLSVKKTFLGVGRIRVTVRENGTTWYFEVGSEVPNLGELEGVLTGSTG